MEEQLETEIADLTRWLKNHSQMDDHYAENWNQRAMLKRSLYEMEEQATKPLMKTLHDATETIARQMMQSEDSAIAQFIKSQADHVIAKGGDLTEYELVRADGDGIDSVTRYDKDGEARVYTVKVIYQLRPMRPPIDWRAAFKKYATIVDDEEGTYFLNEGDWTKEEWEEIYRMTHGNE